MRKPLAAPSNARRVAILGVGLIGGSLGQALRRRHRGRSYRVIGVGRHLDRLKKARSLGAIDELTTDLKAGVRDADIIVLCVPVQTIVPLAARIAPFAKPGAVITDVGSVKQTIVRGMKKALGRRKDVSFVGAHPMAGLEVTGVANAKADLFRGATCVLTPGSAPATALVRRMWTDAGADCISLSPKLHDEWIAVTSHLPHLLAFALFAQVWDASRADPRVRSLVAGSFRDMTRVAGSDPDLWTGILDMNRSALKKAFDGLTRQAKALSSRRRAALHLQLRRLAAAKRSF